MSKLKKPEVRLEIEDVENLLESVPIEHVEKVAKITCAMITHPSYGKM